MAEEPDPKERQRKRVFEGKRHWHKGRAERSIRQKLEDLSALQHQGATLRGQRRGLAWWEHPWPVSQIYPSNNHLREYLASRARDIAKLSPKPLIVRWLESETPHMKIALGIFDRKVERLMSVEGGRRKLDDWLLSGDKNFASLSAERFILDYLSALNPKLSEELRRAGPDATLQLNGSRIGIEVTSLNGAVGTWILGERLTEALDESGFLKGKRVEFKYSYERVAIEAANSSMQGYIHDIARAVESADDERQRELAVYAQVEPGHGTIAFDVLDARTDWFRVLTRDVEARLSDKRQQLSVHSRNLVFVAVNHLPHIWPFPQIFEAMHTADGGYERPITRIHEFWRQTLHAHPQIDGICYFLYAIDREGPFYPLRLFWRDDRAPVPINIG